MNSIKQINPGGIILNADGSITLQDKELKQAVSKAVRSVVKPAADNYGSCTNGGTCSGSNLNCSNTGDCSGAQNYGKCKDKSPIAQ